MLITDMFNNKQIMVTVNLNIEPHVHMIWQQGGMAKHGHYFVDLSNIESDKIAYSTYESLDDMIIGLYLWMVT